MTESIICTVWLLSNLTVTSILSLKGTNEYRQPHSLNSSPPGQNDRHLSDDIFKCIFMNKKFCSLILISLKFVPKHPIDNIPALVEIMAWCQIGDKPLSEPMLTQFTDTYAALGGDELNGEIFIHWDSITHHILPLWHMICWSSLPGHPGRYMIPAWCTNVPANTICPIHTQSQANRSNNMGLLITLGPEQNACHFADNIYWCFFLAEYCTIWLKFHWVCS